MNLLETIITFISYIRQKEKRPLIQIAKEFKKLNGIEIGGPSDIFKLKGAMPIYLYANQVDGVNFSNATIWEGSIQEGNSYNYHKNDFGYQFIAEGTNLSAISNDKYDFALSSHSLEHIANPIKALKEWCRVLKPGAKFVLILPNKDFTFDRKRPVTAFEHLLEDELNNTQEDDTTHFEEVNQLHDMELDKVLGTREALVKRTGLNATYRTVHHHVFDFELIKKMLTHTGFELDYQQNYAPFHMVTIARKK